MAITQAMCTSFKVDILSGGQNFNTTNRALASNTQDVFKIALYTSSATLDATTTAYTTSGETTGTGYTAGGNTLTVSVVPTSSGTTSYLSFGTTSWTTATITARGAMIYNSTNANKAVCILDFGSDKTSTAGTFQINFPTADASNAIIRIA
jgi:hypothetical protein